MKKIRVYAQNDHRAEAEVRTSPRDATANDHRSSLRQAVTLQLELFSRSGA